ncbi:DUF58 domain-containing protein [Psychrobium sp. 1_MG-2023]|uniref:DUF58 domain-containing protein n=1 Tax=Psychrobium sp. 1_MG-2023 TaxID=3062624 RepID=UPI000C335DEF|nr:DUF58 domain-containing protein [Psychrobium sp. 1_MG-2023]MDP2561735.1 DUF58 domain-containing protein [Psychrobium sp. 1_MG-2023]PKF59776.1 DUF58 domain-containing protein [Alteromonadales bacterium alter-6D02]
MTIQLPPFCNGVSLTNKELLEYRGRSALIDLSSNSQIKSHMAGTLVAKTKGRGMEFDEARHYQMGDDIRAIDWRVTARTGKVHTKIYREERERPVVLLVDLSHSQYFGSQLLLKSVQISHLASLLAWSAIANGDRVGALLFNDFEHRELKPRNRHHGALAIVEYLVKIHNQGLDYFKQEQRQDNSFEQACIRLRRVVKPGSLVFLLSDFNHISERATKQLQLLSRHNEIIGCQITDPLEQTLPTQLQGALAVTDGEKRSEFMLNNKRREQYKQANKTQQQALFARLNKLNIKLMQFSSHLPLLEQLKSAAFATHGEQS